MPFLTAGRTAAAAARGLKRSMFRTVVACLATIFSVADGAEVTVTVQGGRTFQAEVDPRSDDRQLWLRFDSGKTTILRPIDWPSIVKLESNGAPMSVEQLRSSMPKNDTALPRPPRLDSNKPMPGMIGGMRMWRVPGGSPRDAAPPSATIRSLAVEVYMANWDADVDSDGIVLRFAALDEFGEPASVSGTVEVELVGERRPPYSRGNAFPILARWTRSVSAATPTTIGGYYRERLEFQAVHPDYQLAWPTYALAHVRLTVPGQGTFEASADAVALRGFTPVRDRLESASGTRFLPNEQTGRGKKLSSTFND